MLIKDKIDLDTVLKNSIKSVLTKYVKNFRLNIN